MVMGLFICHFISVLFQGELIVCFVLLPFKPVLCTCACHMEIYWCVISDWIIHPLDFNNSWNIFILKQHIQSWAAADQVNHSQLINNLHN